jgi:hypothetical protein
MKNVLLLALAMMSAAPAFARDALVIYRLPTKNGRGVADYVDLQKTYVDGSVVHVVTKSGDVIPVEYFRRLSAVVLDAYLRSGYSVDVTDCKHYGKDVPGTTSYEGNTTRKVRTLKYSCGLFASATPLYDVDVKDYVIQNTFDHPLEELWEHTSPRGNMPHTR